MLSSFIPADNVRDDDDKVSDNAHMYCVWYFLSYIFITIHYEVISSFCLHAYCWKRKRDSAGRNDTMNQNQIIKRGFFSKIKRKLKRKEKKRTGKNRKNT